MSYDKISKFLNCKPLGSKKLWCFLKPEVKSVEKEGSAFVLNDSIQKKFYINKNEIMYCYYSHIKNMHIEIFNLFFLHDTRCECIYSNRIQDN